MAFSRTRNIELSVIQHIEDAITTSWTNIPVVKAFLQAYDYPVPVICVRMDSTDTFRLEIGDNALRQQHSFICDIFAKSDGQRLDLADFIVNTVKDGFIYNEYTKNSGDNQTLIATPNGRIVFLKFMDNSRIDFGEDAVEHDKFRHIIRFKVEKVYD
jgi:hypothetical protein